MLTDYYTSITISEKVDVPFSSVTENVVGYYKGFIQPVGSSDVFETGKAGEKATHRLYTGLRTPCQYGYRVTQNGQTYIMISSIIQPGGISGVNDHKEIIMGLLQ